MPTHFLPQYLTFLDFNFNLNYPIFGTLFHKMPIILHTVHESIIMFLTFYHDAQLCTCTHTDTHHKYAYLILVKCIWSIINSRAFIYFSMLQMMFGNVDDFRGPTQGVQAGGFCRLNSEMPYIFKCLHLCPTRGS